MKNFNNVERFRGWCYKILPLVYDDSLSYYETLCKVVSLLNQVIENINNLPDYIAELLSEEKLKEILSTLLNTLEEQIASANEGTSKTATASRSVGELVWLDGKLYKIINNMIAGDQYFENSNCVKVTVEELIKVIYSPSQELLSLNAIIDGEAEIVVGDVHTYSPQTQTITIEKG